MVNLSDNVIRNNLDTLVLMSILNSNKDSNEIRSNIDSLSNTYCVKHGTFYSVMQKLVKNGYMSEYRSSAIDGIRRKYFKITNKGQKYVNSHKNDFEIDMSIFDKIESNSEQNQIIDSFKKEISNVKILEEVNTLINENTQENANEEPSNFEFNALENDEVIDEFDTVSESQFIVEKEEDEQIFSFETNEPIFVKDIKIQEITEENNNISTIESCSEEVVQPKTDLEQILEKSNEIKKEEIIEDKAEDKNIVESVNANNDEVNKETTTLQSSTNNVINSTSQTQNTTNQTVENTNTSNNYINDNIYENDSNRRYYKDVLENIFPKSAKVNSITSDQIFDDSKNVAVEKINENFGVINDFEYAYDDELEEEKPTQKEKFTVNINQEQNKIDFSDIFEMANREGFKVKASISTNKYTTKSINIGKLRLHSALLFYLVLGFELLIVSLTFGIANNFEPYVYALIFGLTFIFPLATIISYFVDKNKMVYEIPKFRDSMEVAILISLQLIVLIVGFAVLNSIDLENFYQILTSLIIPLLIAFNIPLYFIIKYSLLSKPIYKEQ